MESNESINENSNKRTKAERLQRFANLAMAYENDGKQRTMEEVLKEITPETALKFLQHVNGQLRSDGVAKKSEIYGDTTHRMMVDAQIMGGEKKLIAPEPDLQQELFAKYLDAIKKIDDKDKRAILAYYAINNLHLFSDGNGRTSRAIYLLLKHGDLSDAEEIVSHKNMITNALYDYGDSDGAAGRKKFISENGIKSAEWINLVANGFLQGQLVREGDLDDYFSNISIYVHSVIERDDLVSVMMSRSNRQNLSEDESTRLNYAMSDGTTTQYSTLSGLTLAVMLQKKGMLKTVAERDLKNNDRLPIRVNYEEEDDQESKEAVKDTFAGWTPDDYRMTLEVYKELKRKQNELIIRFFTEDIRFSNGPSVADWAMGKE